MRGFMVMRSQVSNLEKSNTERAVRRVNGMKNCW